MPRVKIGPALPDRRAIDVELAHLRDLDVDGLRSRWHTVFGRRAPPHLPRHLLFRVLAYRLQADLLGDLDGESQRLLDRSVSPEDAGHRAVKRAVRLTTSRLRASLPQSMTEIEAGKDLLRAEFAMSTCRLEKRLEQLRHKSTDQFVELGKRAEVINRLKIERDALKVELIELNAQLEALKADKDLLRAEFAMSTCRLEETLEQLKHKSTGQVVELGKRADVIDRLQIERDAQKMELIEFSAQIEASLKQRPIASNERVTAKARRARSSRGRLAADSNDAKQRAL
jgi:DUF2924 family protein